MFIQIDFFPPRTPSKKPLKQTKDGVTAWVCAADHVAYDLIAHLEASGIKVPQHVSVVGFDGISSPLKNLNYPQLRYHIDRLVTMPLKDSMKLLKILTIKAN